jgi:hypothetical protein
MERGECAPPSNAQRSRGNGLTGADPVRAKGTLDYLLWGWGPFRSSFASSSTPAGCLLQLKHGLDEAARGAKSHRKLQLQ